MGMNLENVAKALGISKKAAKALDILDGQSDKKIEQSIYDQAADLLHIARRSNGDASVFDNIDFRVDVFNALEDDLTQIMGLVKSSTKNSDDNECKPDVKKEKEIIYKKSENPGVGWVEMVKTYYPDLVERCGGKMYGNDGAVRALQKALCTNQDGKVDNEKLKLLITSVDMPEEIELPKNINGVERKTGFSNTNKE